MATGAFGTVPGLMLLPLGLALGPGVFALVLAIGGYRSSTDGDVAQPDSALTVIVLGFSVLPAVLTALSLLWLRRYSLDAAQVEGAQVEGAQVEGAQVDAAVTA